MSISWAPATVPAWGVGVARRDPRPVQRVRRAAEANLDRRASQVRPRGDVQAAGVGGRVRARAARGGVSGARDDGHGQPVGKLDVAAWPRAVKSLVRRPAYFLSDYVQEIYRGAW